MATFYAADRHFGHRNIGEHRPWPTFEEMDAALIERWNEVVAPNNIVWALGDIALHNRRAVASFGDDARRELIRIAGEYRLLS